ncbi:hypothetical protein EJ02DRAFT_116646 [Clathrospora elynae]|uniref:Uncharacterized protein n=1 Tax=Clathrospora elynae TaxID=706981 RepID=A0A6A5S514_9PLEO|nr:hypothetical protein EJ02DRAFT_116646 [Clathrospora elynae]
MTGIQDLPDAWAMEPQSSPHHLDMPNKRISLRILYRYWHVIRVLSTTRVKRIRLTAIPFHQGSFLVWSETAADYVDFDLGAADDVVEPRRFLASSKTTLSKPHIHYDFATTSKHRRHSSPFCLDYTRPTIRCAPFLEPYERLTSFKVNRCTDLLFRSHRLPFRRYTTRFHRCTRLM